MIINNKLVITDKSEKLEDENLLRLIIKKGAFGSGEHETTKACLEHITNIDFDNKKVIDIGCGTGILSIATSILGANEIIAFDPEFSACETTVKNIKLNNLSNIHTVCSFNNAVKGKYDIILANVYYYVLLDIASYIRNIANEKSILILSGIPFSENFDVRIAYEKLGFKVIKNSYHEEYTTIFMQLLIV